jgi:hypothetical protein
VTITSEQGVAPGTAPSTASPRPAAGATAPGIAEPVRADAARYGDGPDVGLEDAGTAGAALETESSAPESAADVVEPAAVQPAASAAAPPPGDLPDARPDSHAEQAGFTLRFASDAALLRLVGRGEAGLYVFDGGATLRLDYGPDGAAFAPAPGPGRYHEIAAATVPDLLRRTLARRDRRSTDVVWGVTLPASTRDALARLISNHRSGELVIDGRGRVRLETRHDRT